MLSILPLSACGGEEIKEHTLTFVANNLTTITKTETHRYNEEFNLTENTFTYSRHQFVGWSNAPDGDIEYYDTESFLMPDKDVTLYAKWQHMGYFILFDNNEGEGTMEPVLHTAGELFILPKCTFTKEGYTFAGWATHPMGQVEVSDHGTYYMPEDDVILYAKWNFDGYDLTLDYQLPHAAKYITKLHYKDDFVLPKNQYEKAGYHFAGWSLEPEGEVIIGDNEQIVMPKENLTLYAIWEENICTISFDSNSATGNMKNILDQQGKTIDLPRCTFIKDHYSFKGWSTSKDGEVIYKDCASIVLPNEESLTLYAIWEYVVTITINLNEGSIRGESIKIYQLPLNESLDLIKEVGIPTPSNPNKTFIGYKNAFNNKYVVNTKSSDDETYNAIYYDYNNDEATANLEYDMAQAKIDHPDYENVRNIGIGVIINNALNYIRVDWGDGHSEYVGEQSIVIEEIHYIKHTYENDADSYSIKIYGPYEQITEIIVLSPDQAF